MNAGTCNRCGAKIYWLKRAVTLNWNPVPTAKPNPIDIEPHEDGNLVITAASVVRGLYRFATGNEKELKKYYGKPLYISHFQTCPVPHERDFSLKAREYRQKRQKTA